MSSSRTNRIWLTGATGLVGRATLGELLAREELGRIEAFVRRPTGAADPRLSERIVDFERLDEAFGEGPVDVAITCLGTTIRKAGSRERFRRVDHDYVLAFARAAKAAGARRFIAVSSIGASARSLAFYSRVKGEVEDALAGLGFDSLVVVRPSLLLGEREERRLGEQIAAPFSKLLPASIAGIEGATVARAIARLALAEGEPGVRVVPSAELQALGG